MEYIRGTPYLEHKGEFDVIVFSNNSRTWQRDCVTHKSIDYYVHIFGRRRTSEQADEEYSALPDFVNGSKVNVMNCEERRWKIFKYYVME